MSWVANRAFMVQRFLVYVRIQSFSGRSTPTLRASVRASMSALSEQTMGKKRKQVSLCTILVLYTATLSQTPNLATVLCQ